MQQAASPRKRFLQPQRTGVSMSQKAVRVLRGGKSVRILIFCFFVPPWSKPLWMSNDPSLLSPWELLGRLALCPRYLGLFGDLGFLEWGTGEWGCILCGCSRVGICADCAFLGLECLLFWERVSLPRPRKWRWFLGAWVLDWRVFFITSFFFLREEYCNCMHILTSASSSHRVVFM